MDMKVSNDESQKKTCGIILIAGAAICSISLFTLVSYAFDGESQHAFLYLIRNLAFISGFAAAGFGALTDRHDLFPIGLFACAAASVLDVYFPLYWIDSFTKYGDSLADGLGGGNFLLLLCYLSEVAGFLFMGILFSGKTEWQFPQIKSVAIACVAAFIALTVICALYYISEYRLTLWGYLSSYITGSNALSVAGATGVLLMPSAFSEELPKLDPAANTGAVQSANQPGQTGKTESTDSKVSEEDVIEQIKKYKQLLDMGIITEEEFQLKKTELLK